MGDPQRIELEDLRRASAEFVVGLLLVVAAAFGAGYWFGGRSGESSPTTVPSPAPARQARTVVESFCRDNSPWNPDVIVFVWSDGTTTTEEAPLGGCD